MRCPPPLDAPNQLLRKPRVRDLFDAAVHSELFAQTDTRRLVVIHNNAITFPLMPTGIQQFDWCAACTSTRCCAGRCAAAGCALGCITGTHAGCTTGTHAGDGDDCSAAVAGAFLRAQDTDDKCWRAQSWPIPLLANC